MRRDCEAVIDAAIEASGDSTFYGTRHAWKRMLPQKRGRIIDTASVEGEHGQGGLSHSVAATHAINGFTKTVPGGRHGGGVARDRPSTARLE
ncbi:MAG: SDR family NAD(P)-dependent oxidoreductase [Myxococcales bacterium]|nr:SDR family NAD(P)-dependent oxidoreductase [Myxococcales bacterium]